MLVAREVVVGANDKVEKEENKVDGRPVGGGVVRTLLKRGENKVMKGLGRMKAVSGGIRKLKIEIYVKIL